MARSAAQQREWRAQRRAQGLCIECPAANDGSMRCADCNGKASIRKSTTHGGRIPTFEDFERLHRE